MKTLNKAIEELRKLAVAGLVLVALSTILGFMADWHSLLDWFADFRLAYVLCAMVPIVLWLRHDKRVVGVAVATIAVNLVVLAPWAARPTHDTCTPQTVAVALNTFGTFADLDILAAQLEASDADIVFASELMPKTRDRIAQFYPHQVVDPYREADVGVGLVGLFSRHPIVEVELLRTEGGRPFYNAVIETPEGLVRVLGAHTAAPHSQRSSADRNANIKQLAKIARDSAEPVILLGDLNVTMFSPHYTPLAEAGLANVRLGRGVKSTWPAFAPVIPIDHVLHSDDFTVCEVEVGESFESDHLPLRAGLARVSNVTKNVGVVASR